MVKVNPTSIKDLLDIKKTGAPVTLTSHPGNASIYKLSLWCCGVPEHFWDVTCCVADANNWPMHRLNNGQAELLLDEWQYQRIKKETNSDRRFITAYQKTREGGRLGRFHVKVCEKLFPEAISSCSRILLSEAENVKEIFGYLAETRWQTVFARFITSEGIAIPIVESGLKPHELVKSFMNVLYELDHMLFNDEPIETQGGACYDGVIVPLSMMLAQYWQTGRIDRYDISGPDMIHYATTPEYQENLSEMLQHLHRWNPKLIPSTIVIRILPGTVARVGHIPGHISESVMKRKLEMLQINNKEEFNSRRREIRKMAVEDEDSWPIRIKANKDHYFSQHDLMTHGGRIIVDDFWKRVPLDQMWNTLVNANALLHIK